MELKLTTEFKRICIEILELDYSLEKWASIESCDMFQTENYCGGFDATEIEFCFSYYLNSGEEYWFQFDLESVKNIVFGSVKTIRMELAN